MHTNLMEKSNLECHDKSIGPFIFVLNGEDLLGIRFHLLLGPTECQDGVTNNCTQECTRYRYANTGVYNCSCYPGYNISTDDSTSCHGKQSIMLILKGVCSDNNLYLIL